MEQHIRIVIFSAPSGAGKTSLLNAMLARFERLKLSVSHTTRPPRPGEEDGRDYYFVSEEEFRRMIAAGDFLEYAHVFGCLYGTSKQFVFDQIVAGYNIGLELDWQGARSVREHLEDVASVFILPPSQEELRRRLEARGQDSDAVIESRMDEAMAEMRHYHEFDYIVVNDDFAMACETLATILRTGGQSSDSVEHGRHVLRQLGV